MKGFAELLNELSSLLDRQAITLPGAALRMATYIQGQMACSQVSVWVLEPGQGGPLMRRIGGFDGSTGAALHEVALQCGLGFAGYFDRLATRGVYVCPDTLADERLAPMRDSYLVPNDIRSALYATIGANGTTTALLCCSEHGAPREWAPQEVRALKTYANAISLRRARRRRREAEAASLAQRLLHPHDGAPGDAAKVPPPRPLP